MNVLVALAALTFSSAFRVQNTGEVRHEWCKRLEDEVEDACPLVAATFDKIMTLKEGTFTLTVKAADISLQSCGLFKPMPRPVVRKGMTCAEVGSLFTLTQPGEETEEKTNGFVEMILPIPIREADAEGMTAKELNGAVDILARKFKTLVKNASKKKLKSYNWGLAVEEKEEQLRKVMRDQLVIAWRSRIALQKSLAASQLPAKKWCKEMCKDYDTMIPFLLEQVDKFQEDVGRFPHVTPDSQAFASISEAIRDPVACKEFEEAEGSAEESEEPNESGDADGEDSGSSVWASVAAAEVEDSGSSVWASDAGGQSDTSSNSDGVSVEEMDIHHLNRNIQKKQKKEELQKEQKKRMELK